MFGVSDSMNLKLSFLGWLGGPNISSEWFSDRKSAMSTDVIFSSSWDFSSVSSVGGVQFSTSGGPSPTNSMPVRAFFATSVHLSMVMPLVRLVPLGTKAKFLPNTPWTDGAYLSIDEQTKKS